MTELEKLEVLKEKVFAQSNEHCFIERERFLNSVPPCKEKTPEHYARLFAGLLEQVSTPVEPEDIFVGRVVEGPPESAVCPNRSLFAKGHLTPDYRRVLSRGYRGILAEIRQNAAGLGTGNAAIYAKNAETVVEAIRRFALRYAEAAEKAGNRQAAKALRRVPYEPAYDLYSALQGMWLIHMIASCYVGSRDYAFGYMDEYLYPYYLKEKEAGATDEELAAMLAGFFVKTNEICGRHPHNYQQKPVLCQSAKQYILLDGGRANALSEVILEAAKLNRMAQPQFTVVLETEVFKASVFEAMAELTDKLHVYNSRLCKEFLKSKGLPEEYVERPGFSACCTADFCGHACREEFYLPTVQRFCDTLYQQEFSSKEEFLTAFSRAVTAECEQYLEESREPERDWARCVFVLDCLLVGACNEVCDYPPYGLRYRAKNIFLPGLATLGDSLCALDTLVFQGELPYRDFVKLLKADFAGEEPLHARLCALPKFGNDSEADRYTVEMAELLVDAVERARHTEKEILLPSFYSLQRENEWAAEIPATPDGRRAGTPFSENQSPVYGADRQGITALLNSLSKIPFAKTAAGGLNLTFSSAISAGLLKALIETYFKQGGLHAGITVLDRGTLRDAMKHPEKYRSLTVRLYGFSEYFVSLPEWQQIAVLNRTAY